jgi:hypothetical protein
MRPSRSRRVVQIAWSWRGGEIWPIQRPRRRCSVSALFHYLRELAYGVASITCVVGWPRSGPARGPWRFFATSAAAPRPSASIPAGPAAEAPPLGVTDGFGSAQPKNSEQLSYIRERFEKLIRIAAARSLRASRKGERARIEERPRLRGRFLYSAAAIRSRACSPEFCFVSRAAESRSRRSSRSRRPGVAASARSSRLQTPTPPPSHPRRQRRGAWRRSARR